MHLSVIAKGAVARLGLKPYPLSLNFELSWLCNLACTYCDRHTPMRNELSREQILAVLEDFYALGMREISLDGGEPLAHRNVDEIVDWLVARRVTIAMNTNGILVPRKISLVRKLSKIKISLDGPRERHDSMRGRGAFDHAIEGARAAIAEAVKVEFTCTMGRHNLDVLEEVLDIAERMKTQVVFQPALNSLFNDSIRDGSGWMPEPAAIRAAFARLERFKRTRSSIGNRWASLRHFRNFPDETRPPCAAGWVECTMDPEGVLFPCGQLDRGDRSNSVIKLGVAQAFANLSRTGCGQCWCARLLETNYDWGCRIDKMLPPMRLRSRESIGA